MSIFDKFIDLFGEDRADAYRKQRDVKRKIKNSKRYAKQASGEDSWKDSLSEHKREILLLILFLLLSGATFYGFFGDRGNDSDEFSKNDEMLRLASMNTDPSVQYPRGYTPTSYRNFCGIAEAQNGTGVRYTVVPKAYQNGRGICPSQDELNIGGYSYVIVTDDFKPKATASSNGNGKSCGVARFINNPGYPSPSNNMLSQSARQSIKTFMEEMEKKYPLVSAHPVSFIQSLFDITPNDDGICPSNKELTKIGDSALEKAGEQGKYTFLYVDAPNENSLYEKINQRMYPLIPFSPSADRIRIASSMDLSSLSNFTTDDGTGDPKTDDSVITFIKDFSQPFSKEALEAKNLVTSDGYILPAWMMQKDIKSKVCKGDFKNCSFDFDGFYLFNKENTKLRAFLPESESESGNEESLSDSNGIKIPEKFLTADSYSMCLGNYKNCTLTEDESGNQIFVTQDGNQIEARENMFSNLHSFYIPQISVSDDFSLANSSANSNSSDEYSEEDSIEKYQQQSSSNNGQSNADRLMNQQYPLDGQKRAVNSQETLQEIARQGYKLDEAIKFYEAIPDQLDPNDFPPPPGFDPNAD